MGRTELTQVWVGLENYRTLFADATFRRALLNTTYYTLLSVPIGVLVSLVLAVALNTDLRFRNLYRLVFFLPVLTMPVAIGVVWNWIYNPDFGLFNQLLGALRWPPHQMADRPGLRHARHSCLSRSGRARATA